jgi:hypothetical protein
LYNPRFEEARLNKGKELLGNVLCDKAATVLDADTRLGDFLSEAEQEQLSELVEDFVYNQFVAYLRRRTKVLSDYPQLVLGHLGDWVSGTFSLSSIYRFEGIADFLCNLDNTLKDICER